LLACVEDQKLRKKEALRCSTSFFDHSNARSTANPKLAFQAQTLDLQSFRFAKNGFPKKPEFALRAPLFQVISVSPSVASGKIQRLADGQICVRQWGRIGICPYNR